MADRDCDCREVVREWLEVNSQRFTIPGTDWGRDLLESLHCVMRTSEGETVEEWQAETTYPYLENQGRTEFTASYPTREGALAAGKDRYEGYGKIVALRHRTVTNGDWVLTSLDSTDKI